MAIELNQIWDFPIKEFHPFPRALMGVGAHDIIGVEAKNLGFKRTLLMTTGLRGSGIIEAIAEMYLAGVINQDGLVVDDVFVGCANPEGEQGFQIGRQISLRALGQEVPGVTVNRYCASGLEPEIGLQNAGPSAARCRT